MKTWKSKSSQVFDTRFMDNQIVHAKFWKKSLLGTWKHTKARLYNLVLSSTSPFEGHKNSYIKEHWSKTSHVSSSSWHLNDSMAHFQLPLAPQSKAGVPLVMKLSKSSCLVLVLFIKGHRIGPNVQFCFKSGSGTPSFNPSKGCRPLKMGPIWNLMAPPDPKFFIFQLLLVIQSD